MIVDMPLAELEHYHPPLTRQDDFDAFWEETLEASALQPLNATFERIDYPVERVSVYDARFDGFRAGDAPVTRVAGWYLVPRDPIVADDGTTPTIVVYHGYSGARGVPSIHLHWALQGYRVFAVDTRGQNGDTPDNQPYASGAILGCMTRGIADPRSYYYRFAYTDCVRAVDVMRAQEGSGALALTGGSQGGALTLAVAALSRDPGIVAAAPDVPFLCHFARSLEIFGDGPYHELVGYWKNWPDRVAQNMRTLSYFDGMNLAPRITCPTLLSVALLDTVCPPSTGFAVYSHLGAANKQLEVYPYNGHEGGGALHEEKKYRFLGERLRSAQ